VHGLCVKHRHLEKGDSLARDVARILANSSRYGKVVVVTAHPLGMLPAIRKQWLRLERKIWIERARTLKAPRIMELSGELNYMQSVGFTTKLPDDILEAEVTFAKADDLVRVAPECKTMIVTYNFSKLTLHMITSWMPRNGVVVVYDKK
jgi:hypothetical protein